MTRVFIILGCFFCSFTIAFSQSDLEEAELLAIEGMLVNRQFEQAEHYIISNLALLGSKENLRKFKLQGLGISLFQKTRQWKKGIRLFKAANASLKKTQSPESPKPEEIGLFHLQAGILAYHHSYVNRKIENRKKTRILLQSAWDKLSDSHPHKPESGRFLGLIMRLLGNSSEAEKQLLATLAICPSDSSIEAARVNQTLAMLYTKNLSLSKSYQANVHFSASKKVIENPKTIGVQPEDIIFHNFYQAELMRKFYGNDLIFTELLQQSDSLIDKKRCYSNLVWFTHLALGTQYDRQGKLELALAQFQKTRDEYNPQLHPPKSLCNIYSSLGGVYLQLQELNLALEYQQSALDAIVPLLPTDSHNVYLSSHGNALNNIANVLSEMGQNPIKYYLKAHQEYLKLVSLKPINQYIYNLALLDHNLGLTFSDSASFQESNSYFNDAISNLKLLGTSQYSMIGTEYMLQAKNYWQMGNLISCQKSKDLGFNYLASSPLFSYRQKAEGYMELVELLRLQNLPQQVLPIVDLVLELVIEKNSLVDSSEEIILEHLHAMRAYQAQGLSYQQLAQGDSTLPYLRHALKSLHKAIDIAHTMRQQQSAQVSQVKFNSQTRSNYEAAIAVAEQLFQITGDPDYLHQAFDLAEQSRGTVLLAAVSTSKAASTAGVPDSLLDAMRQLQARVDELRRNKNSETDSYELQTINAELVRSTSSQDSLRNILKTQYGKYYAMVHETKTTALDEIQADLKKRKSAMIEYFYGDSLLFTFLVTPDTFLLQKEAIDPEFLAQLDTIQQILPNRSYESYADTYAKVAHGLYQKLMGDLPVSLPEKILIIPDGRLNFLPFDALIAKEIDPELDQLMFFELPYLLFDHIISYDYSYTIRKRRGKYKSDGALNMLAMAPSFSFSELPDLPNALKSVQYLGEHFHATEVLSGNLATETAFRAQASKYGIIELATHGQMDSVNSANCKLYFSPDSLNDGSLHLGEIYNLDLNARMAVLEACESGLGPNSRGEGVMSLARGFSYAGCHTIVTSLWNVSDGDITMDIIANFYHNLSEQMEVDEALTQAKRDYLLQFRESPGNKANLFKPYYWAEFIVIGDLNPIDIQEVSTYEARTFLIPLLILAAFLLIYFLFRRMKTRQKIA